MAARYEDPDWCEQHRLRLDYSYVMEDTIGTPAGVSRRELADAATRMAAVDARVRDEHKAGVLGFMDPPHRHDGRCSTPRRDGGSAGGSR